MTDLIPTTPVEAEMGALLGGKVTTQPTIPQWVSAYTGWLPKAIAVDQADLPDAFRAGYVAGYLAALDAREKGNANAE